MGWLYMQSLNGHSGPAHISMISSLRPRRPSSKVLRSDLRGRRTYYAAIERVRPMTRASSSPRLPGPLQPRDREGYIFGYKDSMKPWVLRIRLSGGNPRSPDTNRQRLRA